MSAFSTAKLTKLRMLATALEIKLTEARP